MWASTSRLASVSQLAIAQPFTISLGFIFSSSGTKRHPSIWVDWPHYGAVLPPTKNGQNLMTPRYWSS
jgi:hypothetical protein